MGVPWAFPTIISSDYCLSLSLFFILVFLSDKDIDLWFLFYFMVSVGEYLSYTFFWLSKELKNIMHIKFFA